MSHMWLCLLRSTLRSVVSMAAWGIPRVSEEKHCQSQVKGGCQLVICHFGKDCFSAVVRAVEDWGQVRLCWVREASSCLRSVCSVIFDTKERLEQAGSCCCFCFQIILVKRSCLQERFYYSWSESLWESTRRQRDIDGVRKRWEQVIKNFKKN